jgi:hypothetical protein
MLGSNSALFFLVDLCEQHNIKIAGIIDSDYYGNTSHLENIPVIDTEDSLNDPVKLQHYKENYNFFLSTSWVTGTDNIQLRNLEKRKKLIGLIEEKNLPCISLIDSSSRVHKSNQIGKNVIVDSLVYISPRNIIGDYTAIWAATMIGYCNTIGKSCVFQRHSGIMHYNKIGDHVYFGLHTQDSVGSLNIANGTIIHPCLMIRRDTKENEVISLAGKDLRKVYNHYTIVD